MYTYVGGYVVNWKASGTTAAGVVCSGVSLTFMNIVSCRYKSRLVDAVRQDRNDSPISCCVLFQPTL